MITKETAMSIAMAYREIETAEKLLAVIKEARDRHEMPDLRDAFGRRQQGLQLGIPSGENGQRLYDVPYTLAVPVIEAHVANQRACLGALMETARYENTEEGPRG